MKTFEYRLYPNKAQRHTLVNAARNILKAGAPPSGVNVIQ